MNPENSSQILRVYSNEPDFLEVINPDIEIEAKSQAKISLLFKNYPESAKILYKIFITKNDAPWQKIMLTANYTDQ